MKVPSYEYDPNPGDVIEKGTKVVIRGFNQNVKRDFSHRILSDYITWFTKFASFEWIFEPSKPKRIEDSETYSKGPRLFLHGLGYEKEWEDIRFGHYFPVERTSSAELKKMSDVQLMRWYVKRWVRRGIPVKEVPTVKLDVVFSLEGDLVRRDHNPMISYQGKQREEGDYTIEQRYGLWAGNDYIPVRTVNDWFSKGKSEWTKFHAFVNCQDFSLTVRWTPSSGQR